MVIRKMYICIRNSGSPFPPVTLADATELTPSQGNNAYILPGVALGVFTSKSSRVPDKIFLVAAKVCKQAKNFCVLYYFWL